MAKIKRVDFAEIENRLLSLSYDIEAKFFSAAVKDRTFLIYGVPRGGVPVAYGLIPHLLQRGFKRPMICPDPGDAHIIVDDLIDSGATKARYQEQYQSIPFFVLFTKINKDSWLHFPWEGESNVESAEDIGIRLLQFIGEDPKREGLHETPTRFIKAWNEMTSGYKVSPKDVLKSFEDGAQKCDEMIMLKDVPVHSNCEHHLLPFIGTATIGYVPNGRIVGVSKLTRLVEIFSRRLQVQERLTNQIADALNEETHPLGVGVIIRCRHLCMEMRGVNRPGQEMVSSALRGVFKDEPDARFEFLNLTRKS